MQPTPSLAERLNAANLEPVPGPLPKRTGRRGGRTSEYEPLVALMLDTPPGAHRTTASTGIYLPFHDAKYISSLLRKRIDKAGRAEYSTLEVSCLKEPTRAGDDAEYFVAVENKLPKAPIVSTLLANEDPTFPRKHVTDDPAEDFVSDRQEATHTPHHGGMASWSDVFADNA